MDLVPWVHLFQAIIFYDSCSVYLSHIWLGPGTQIFMKPSSHPVDCETATKYSAILFSQIKVNILLYLCNNNDQTLFFNAFTFARSLWRCWKPWASPSDCNISPGTWRILMHEKPCLIPILCCVRVLTTFRHEKKQRFKRFNPLPHRGAFLLFCKQSRPRSGSSCKSCLIRVYYAYGNMIYLILC